MNSALTEVSDWDNTYRVPPQMVDEFNANCTNPYQEWIDEWYDWCDEFNIRWSEYQV